MKRTAIQLLVIILTTLSMQSCFNKVGAKPPERHPSIPLNTTWAGGVDGGEWYEIVKASGNAFSIRIYNDFTGEIEKEDVFLVHSNCTTNNLDSAALLQNLSGFDGQTIYLKIIHNNKYCSLSPATTLTTAR